MDTLTLFMSCILFISTVCGYQPPPQWCYRCVSSQPGCGDDFNWLWHWSKQCPELGDKCVKVIERKGGDTFITRDCLSVVRHGFRTDIPADHFEGCRRAIRDPHLANYVNNTIKELDIYRDHYDSVEFCFCFFKNRCNTAASLTVSAVVLFIVFGRGLWHLIV